MYFVKDNLFSSIGNKTRVKILACLFDREKTVGELIGNCDLSQSAVSQHLSYLRANGLVKAKKVGKYHIYSTKSRKLSKLCKELISIGKKLY